MCDFVLYVCLILCLSVNMFVCRFSASFFRIVILFFLWFDFILCKDFIFVVVVVNSDFVFFVFCFNVCVLCLSLINFFFRRSNLVTSVDLIMFVVSYVFISVLFVWMIFMGLFEVLLVVFWMLLLLCLLLLFVFFIFFVVARVVFVVDVNVRREFCGCDFVFDCVIFVVLGECLCLCCVFVCCCIMGVLFSVIVVLDVLVLEFFVIEFNCVFFCVVDIVMMMWWWCVV